MKYLFAFAVVLVAAFYSVSSEDRTLVRRKRWEDFPNVTMNFDCANRFPGGYYADIENDCKIFYICMPKRFDKMVRVPMFCQPPTIFDQRLRICNWPQYVDCAGAEAYFENNFIQYPPAQNLDINV